ncbi:MAG: MotA/TolQ/ExbB proton channel family protein [Pseudomonadales bacterium]|nr:MotA/TolQ/ExbB proton channel family protein [Pseudomonadales bacterium]
MSFLQTLQVYATNPIMWALLVLGLVCYFLLLDFIFSPQDARWKQKLAIWLKVLPILLSALPLLGLLGTISGLMQTFRELAGGQGLDQQVYLSSGISEALLTTQLGLVLVVPGLLLLSWLRSLYRNAEPRDAQ